MALADDSSTPTTETLSPEGEKPASEEVKPEEGKKAKKKDAGLAVLNVFDGAPKDPEAARRAAPADGAAPSEEKGKKGKGKRGRPPAPPELTEEEEAARHARLVLQARGTLLTLINMQKMICTRQYAGYISEELLASLLSKLDLTEEELNALAPPLADGMVEGGVELPWWAQFGLALGGSGILQRQASVAAALKAAVQDHEAQVGQTKVWNADKGTYE